MRTAFLVSLAFATPIFAFAGCSSSTPVAPIPDDGGPGDDAAPDVSADASSDAAPCAELPCTTTNIRHIVIVIQENKTFDVNLGGYCTAATGSNPTCTSGPSCCEAAPATYPGSGESPLVLGDVQNAQRDPSHLKACEIEEMNGGKMDKYLTASCGNKGNFAIASPDVIKPLWDFAAAGAIGDRYFQPVAGQSASNDMYFARAQWVYDDNHLPKDAIGSTCDIFGVSYDTYTDTTIGDLLKAKGVSWTFYAEGFQKMKDANGTCIAPPPECGAGVSQYPCIFDPSDDPFEFYPGLRDQAPYIADLGQLATDLGGGTLPAVSFVKALGYKTEHPGSGDKISDGMAFLTTTIGAIQASAYAKDTLIVITYDEGGGFFDHVSPPADSSVDHQPYGTRIPFIALGPFVKKGAVSHTTMEHSSLVKFIEYNWLDGQTGQLNGRDKVVANIGSVLDEAKTGTKVPED